MDFNKTVFFFCAFALSAFNSFGQSNILRIEIYHDFYYETPCLQLTIVNNRDTVYSQIISDEYEVLIDSLEIGRYSVNLTNCGPESDEFIQSVTKIVEIKPFQVARIDFDLSQNVWYTDVDAVTLNEIIRSRSELQFNVSYFDFRWNPDGNNPKFNLGIGYSGYHWNSFSKHFGFLVGGGIGYSFAPLRIDSSSTTIYQEDVKSNYYSYINAHFDMKFRFSTSNQQSVNISGHSIFIDVGLQYNLPLYFKRVTRFNVHDKVVNSFIHQYLDFRAYVNVGVTNVQIFASYRPFDFIRGSYPELPRYDAGIKFNMNY